MNRWFWALPVLLWAAGITSANYILIIINLGETKEAPAVAGGGPGGAQGGGPGGAGKGGGFGGAGGQVGQLGGVGQLGAQGGARGGQLGGALGAAGGQLGQVGGQLGARGGQAGQLGGAFGQMGAGNRGGPPTPPPADFDPSTASLHVVAIVDVSQMPNAAHQLVKVFDLGAGSIFIRHKWGGSSIAATTHIHDASIIRINNDKNPLKSVAKRFEERFDPKRPDSKPGHSEKYTPDKLFELAEWALAHGLIGKEDRVAQVMDALADMDAKHPAVAPYRKVKDFLAKPLAKSDMPAALKGRTGNAFKPSEGAHYVLFHDLKTPPEPEEIHTRLERLEEALKSYYYWFAFKGANSLPEFPREKLVAVMTGNEREFDRLYDQFQAGQMVAGLTGVAGEAPKPANLLAGLNARGFRPLVVNDGFFARRDNITVFSSKRLDREYDALEKQSQPYWTHGFNRQEIIKGKKGLGVARGASEDLTARAQTIALVLKVMEHDSELSGTSHDASRQLLYASGLLPRNVLVPEWVEFGMGGLFETSPGSPWPTIADVNYEYMNHFKAMKRQKKLERTPLETLRAIITDSYFRRVPGASEKDRQAALRQARATAWALTYFLAQKKFDGLQRYFKELRGMPRDLELNDDMLVACFARAFGCIDQTKKVDQGKLDSLAKQWNAFTEEETGVEPEMQAVQALIRAKLYEVLVKKQENLAVQPGPGGRPPGRPPGAGAGAGGGAAD